ncbi:MAG TPA: glycosyl hydrolase family 28 protein [Kiritimatiellia bacterium]|nr:glycosyl hydrolase family 28 protein [Kiritimatiellia bacterium]HOM58266.1 glycosyl hydrolase family 28 protein [Kiritimatiellia bacterium]HPC49187.1 glycosyl hydrolase family 28 protein [Kiritimatiellia bacterium]HPK37125.1 glycosyl hydrolase family 28 protein [Kiritimatiellia bacterium]HPW75161.1 glycosyl hydrolase family 28 protein [Kiritimatiellia bacterium]
MRRWIGCLVMAALTARGAGQDGVFQVTAYGAVPDGVTDNTAAIQKAIDACAAAGGGTVRVAGGAFMTYTLYPRSNTRLEIEAGASLEGGPDPLRYPEFVPSPHWRVEYSLRRNKRAMFYAVAQTNLTICGRGTINGHAELFTEPSGSGHWWKRKHDQLITGRNIFLVGCSDVTLEGFSIYNPAGWSMWLLDCDRVNIRGLKIDMNLKFPNGDGIHIGSCRDVTVSDCIVRSSDDSIILRAYQHQLNEPKACERVVVANCVLESRSSAIRIGWTHDYEIKDCRFSNLVIRDSITGISIVMPAVAHVPNDPPRGPGVPPLPEGDAVRPFGVENVHFSDISMNCRDPIRVSFAPDTKVSRLRNITFSNMTIRSPEYPSFVLRKGDRVSDILLSNVRFELLPGGKNTFNIRGVERLTLDRVTFIDSSE